MAPLQYTLNPQQCTPQDLKLIPTYFREFYEFTSDISKIKTGAILKTNFFGAPAYGHVVLCLSPPRLTKVRFLNETFENYCSLYGIARSTERPRPPGDGRRDTYVYEINTIVNSGSGGEQVWLVEPKEPIPQQEIEKWGDRVFVKEIDLATSSSSKPNYYNWNCRESVKFYAMNPRENLMIDETILKRLASPYTTQGYSSLKASLSPLHLTKHCFSSVEEEEAGSLSKSLVTSFFSRGSQSTVEWSENAIMLNMVLVTQANGMVYYSGGGRGREREGDNLKFQMGRIPSPSPQTLTMRTFFDAPPPKKKTKKQKQNRK
jgi:hypothetical protein